MSKPNHMFSKLGLLTTAKQKKNEALNELVLCLNISLSALITNLLPLSCHKSSSPYHISCAHVTSRFPHPHHECL